MWEIAVRLRAPTTAKIWYVGLRFRLGLGVWPRVRVVVRFFLVTLAYPSKARSRYRFNIRI